jgi:glyoxylase-like metal-dependent hydrolase (beta-lactamase superfamily II)
MFNSKLNTKLTRIAGALLFAAAAVATVSADAAAPFARTPAPGYFRLMLGDFEVTAVSDGTIDVPADTLLSEAPAITRQLLAKSFLGSPVEISVNAYLINTGAKLILVDAGAGAFFGPTLGKLVANLKASGYQPEQIDDIYLTHLHPDHAGGIVADGKMLFPNATVHVDRRDVDFWLDQQKMDKAPASSRMFFQVAMAALKPYQAVHHVQTFEHDGQREPGVASYASYGHSAGHTGYVIESKGQKLVVAGDLLHVGAIQLADTSVTIAYDSDAGMAMGARRKGLADAAKNGTLIGAAHMPFPGLGHVVAAGSAYTWLPVNYTQMR